jgi:hypothetical protein
MQLHAKHLEWILSQSVTILIHGAQLYQSFQQN